MAGDDTASGAGPYHSRHDPPRAGGGDTVFDDAIGVQHRSMAVRLRGGMPRAGWKVCVNDARVQKRLGLGGSFVGFLDGARALSSGGTWTVADGAVLGVEPEFAVRFDAAVEAGADHAAIRRAIRGVAPSIEVVDWQGAKFDLATLAASSSFHAGFVVGEMMPFDAVPTLSATCPLLRRGDDTLGVPDPTLVPADLTMLIADVAGFLARYGQAIEAGDWLMCGACTNPARVDAGDVIEADFATLGSTSVRFVR